VDIPTGSARVRAWQERYPALAAEFRDAEGRPPRHSFFFPGDQYVPGFLDALAALGRANPTGRLAEPDDIADVVVFLATDAARYVVGQLLHVNGGDYHG
jgi:NAD(P)-dependent dehydrogenase (short-subunit alcohol dehydrogenase family)